MKDAEINYTDNIINYGHRYDKVYNMNNTNHVGEKIYTDKIGDENLIRNIKKYHELENMGDLQNRYKKELNKIP